MTRRFLQYLEEIRNQPYEGARAMPGDFYTSPEWFSAEQQTLFGHHWVCVGRLEEVAEPGAFFTTEVAGEPLVIIRGEDHRLRALSNVCRHRGTVIVEGKGSLGGLVCPYHHWHYATDGRLLNAPAMASTASQPSDSTIDIAKCRLPVFGCSTWQGFVFVCLGATPPDLQSELAGLDRMIENYHLEQMQLRYLADECWNVNWKCLMENFMEGYHLSPLHRKTLHNVNPSRLCKHLLPGFLYFGYSVGFASRVSGKKIGHPDLSGQEKDTCVMFAVAPGLAVGIGSDYSSFICLQPRSATEVRVRIGLIFYGEELCEQDVDAAIKLFRDTMAEDEAVLLRVQQGLGSGFYTPGPLAPRHLEGTIWDFNQFIARAFNRADTE